MSDEEIDFLTRQPLFLFPHSEAYQGLNMAVSLRYPK